MDPKGVDSLYLRDQTLENLRFCAGSEVTIHFVEHSIMKLDAFTSHSYYASCVMAIYPDGYDEPSVQRLVLTCVGSSPYEALNSLHHASIAETGVHVQNMRHHWDGWDTWVPGIRLNNDQSQYCSCACCCVRMGQAVGTVRDDWAPTGRSSHDYGRPAPQWMTAVDRTAAEPKMGRAAQVSGDKRGYSAPTPAASADTATKQPGPGTSKEQKPDEATGKEAILAALTKMDQVIATLAKAVSAMSVDDKQPTAPKDTTPRRHRDSNITGYSTDMDDEDDSARDMTTGKAWGEAEPGQGRGRDHDSWL